MYKSAEAFRTISEVASEIDVPKHVLRFWEGKFTQLKPMKRGGGRRYYRPEDVDLLRGIRQLLYGNGYTIKGVQKLLKENGVEFVKNCWRSDEDAQAVISSEIPDLAEETARKALEPVKNIMTEADDARAECEGYSERKALGRSVTEDAFAEETFAPVSAENDVDAMRSLLEELEACKRILDRACD